MLKPIYTALIPLLAALSFGTATPTVRSCEQPYYQYDDNVPGSYLVNFTDGYTLQKHFSSVGQKFNVTKLSTGYYANLTTELLAKVRADCGIQFVEDDTFGVLESDLDLDPDALPTPYLLARRGTQQSAPWPLYQLSVSQKDPTDQTYYYLDDVGLGVDVYIVDTGINHPQNEFNDDNSNDRVIDLLNLSTDSDFTDTVPRGHGTSVASAAGGKKYGVAKAATLLNVKFARNGVPLTSRFVDAIQYITVRHNNKKSGASFKGSIINMSFKLKKTFLATEALDRAAAAGISLVSSAGNNGYDPSSRYPSSHPNVIRVGASQKDYTPASFSNYGRDQVTVWAPGKNVPLCSKDGKEILKSGTSYSSPYVAGIIAIFYSFEGTNMNPTLALTRLIDQTDNWITLPSNGGQDWHNSVTAFANTGNRKGAAKNPPVKYIGGPEIAAAPSSTPAKGCQSPDHDDPLTSFTLAQGQSALADFIAQCQGVELTPGCNKGCIFYYNPCSEKYKAKAVDVIMTVTQTEWASGQQSTWPDVAEMDEAVGHIMNDCNTTTTSAKWGGYRSVNVTSGMRMYNVTANQDGQYPQPSGYHTVKVTTQTGGQDCATWDSS